MMLNIGCGRDYRKGWLNIDISPNVSVDFLMDIRKDLLPAKDRTVDLIYISGVLEQIGSNDELLHVMKECYRVLDYGAVMQVVVPNARYAIAHRDPMDVRKFTPETFSYFHAGKQEHRDYGSVYGFDGWSEIVIDENARHILTVTMKK